MSSKFIPRMTHAKKCEVRLKIKTTRFVHVALDSLSRYYIKRKNSNAKLLSLQYEER